MDVDNSQPPHEQNQSDVSGLLSEFFKADIHLKNLMPDFVNLDDSGELISNDLLKSAGLAINTDLNLIICLTCQSAFTSKNIDLHISRTHPNLRIIGETKKTLRNLIDQAGIDEDYPEIELSIEPRIQFAGLALKSGAGCPHCPYAAAAKRVQAHIKIEHRGQSSTITQAIRTQVLNPGVTKAHIRVKPRPAAEAATTKEPDILQQAKDFQWEKHQAGEIPNARMISPWLMRTGWHEHIQPYLDSIPELCDLVTMPKDDEFPGLHQAIKEYFDQATTLLDATDELVLQRLNSNDPDKE